MANQEHNLHEWRDPEVGGLNLGNGNEADGSFSQALDNSRDSISKLGELGLISYAEAEESTERLSLVEHAYQGMAHMGE